MDRSRRFLSDLYPLLYTLGMEPLVLLISSQSNTSMHSVEIDLLLGMFTFLDL
jgi:hypothetical protein